MAHFGKEDASPFYVVRRILLGLTLLALFLLFIVWRVDNPRVEVLRNRVIDAVVPNMEWALVPVTSAARMVDDFESYARVYEQNQQLRRELQQMQAWREAALQLEQENARLLDLNNVRLNPQLTVITGVVVADSGLTYRRSVLLNIGRQDGIRDGWAAMDGLGLVGRIAGSADSTSRVLLLTDSSSMVPVTIQPSAQTALLTGDGSQAPLLEFLEAPDQVRPGDRVETSGDGKVFPNGLFVGRVAEGTDGRLRVRLAADYERLEYLRVLRTRPVPQIGPASPVVEGETIEDTPAPLDGAQTSDVPDQTAQSND